MTWVRYYAKKIFGPYLGYMPPEKANKYMAITRTIYFFSASTLLIIYLKMEKDNTKQTDLESGKPIIEDHSEAHKRMRLGGAEAGIFYEYTPGKGLTKFEVNRQEYLQQLEKESYERAKKAQEKAIAEGRELPPDAIRLV